MARPGLRVELTTNSSRRRRPRRPRHLSPPATCCYPTRTGLTQGTCSPGVDSFAIATATTQPGTGPATEFSYPAGQAARVGQRKATGPAPPSAAHNDLNLSGPRGPSSDGMARHTLGRTRDATLHHNFVGRTLPAGKDHIGPRGPEHPAGLPEGQAGAHTPFSTPVDKRYTTVTNRSPFDSPRANYQQKRETSSHCHAASAPLA